MESDPCNLHDFQACSNEKLWTAPCSPGGPQAFSGSRPAPGEASGLWQETWSFFQDPFTLKSLISGTRLSLFAPKNWPWFQEFSVWWEENWNEPPFLTDFCFFFKAEISLNHRKSTHFRNALRFSHEGTWSMQTNKKGGTFRTTAALRRSNLHCLGLKNGDRRPRSQFRIKDQHRANPEFQYQL